MRVSWLHQGTSGPGGLTAGSHRREKLGESGFTSELSVPAPIQARQKRNCLGALLDFPWLEDLGFLICDNRYVLSNGDLSKLPALSEGG